MFSILFEKIVEAMPFTDRSPEDKEKIEDFDKKMTTALWKEEYDKGDDRHWMKDWEPCPLAKETADDLEKTGLENASILEIGIGNGRDSIFLAKKGHTVTGIDVAEEPVRVAQEKADEENLENVTFEIGDGEKLRYDAEDFDVVYSVAAIHSTLLDNTLSEIYRVLKPGGMVKLFLYTKIKTGPKWIHYWSPEQIRKIASELDFTIEEFHEDHRVDNSVELAGVEGEVNQENHFVVTTMRKK